MGWGLGARSAYGYGGSARAFFLVAASLARICCMAAMKAAKGIVPGATWGGEEGRGGGSRRASGQGGVWPVKETEHVPSLYLTGYFQKKIWFLE